MNDQAALNAGGGQYLFGVLLSVSGRRDHGHDRQCK